MRVHATLHGFAEKERALELPAGALADDAPRALGIRPELVLVFREERPLPGDAPLADGDRIRILRVVSGGARSPGDWRRVKGFLLVFSLVWLVGVAIYGLSIGTNPGWIVLSGVGIVALGALGIGGYARPSLRYPSAIAAGILTVAIAGVTFLSLPVLAGVFGVFASIILPVPERAPSSPEP